MHELASQLRKCGFSPLPKYHSAVGSHQNQDTACKVLQAQIIDMDHGARIRRALIVIKVPHKLWSLALWRQRAVVLQLRLRRPEATCLQAVQEVSESPYRAIAQTQRAISKLHLRTISLNR